MDSDLPVRDGTSFWLPGEGLRRGDNDKTTGDPVSPWQVADHERSMKASL
jgi:hypothetical protein